MQFDSFSEFLNMGGYALYVWLSYGVGLLTLIGIVITSKRAHKAEIKKIRGILQREDAVQQPADEVQA